MKKGKRKRLTEEGEGGNGRRSSFFTTQIQLVLRLMVIKEQWKEAATALIQGLGRLNEA